LGRTTASNLARMDERTTPEEFGLLFKRFLDDIVNRAEVPEGPLLKRLRAHLGGEPVRMPVISEEFERFQQANLQVAMDAYVERPGNSAELIGLAAENKAAVGARPLGLRESRDLAVQPSSGRGPRGLRQLPPGRRSGASGRAIRSLPREGGRRAAHRVRFRTEREHGAETGAGARRGDGSGTLHRR